MLHGVDTDFLVAVEVIEHPCHEHAAARLQELLARGEDVALAPQVLAEFIHIVTDPRRLPHPLSAEQAVARADHWWHAREVVRVLPTAEAPGLFLDWMREHRLGRKRILDTLLAATYCTAGVTHLMTNNGDDFRVFGVFEILPFR